ncbi:hypothetical protein U14_00651 [Candidatus Moduliflexus flocculans]|uniref:HAMP domain-containing protein n=1 Tax=Candidatus Moduliflexus flocculans TaxID=1499966 RepID=A0A0S6VQI8_9BACT|nr:hypothetical protein U14_00651 [Candidatus Moduliflexus flocculans]
MTPMTRRWHQSIQCQLGFSLLAIITIMLAMFGVYQYQETRSDSLQELRDMSAVIQARLSEYLIFPMWNMNFELIERTLLAEMKEKRVYALIVREVSNDAILKGKIRNDQWEIQDVGSAVLPANLLVSRCDIVNEGEKLGSVEIYLTTKFMNERLRRGIEKNILTIIALDIALLFVLSIALRRLLISPITQILRMAKAIADGDFRQDIQIRRQNEIGEFAEAFRHMKETINQVLEEMNTVNEAIQAGKLSSRGKAEAFSGKWQELVIGVNQVITTCVTPLNATSASLERLAKGEIPERVTEAYQGDFDAIKRHLNMLIEATYQTTRMAEEISKGNLTIEARERSEADSFMQALNRMIHCLREILGEMDAVVRTVQTGRLDVRGNADAFSGGWRELVVGVNNVIDAFMQITHVSEQLKMDNLRMKTEMELAQRIQTSLLPKSLEKFHADFEMSAAMLPAEEVGGDYYDALLDQAGSLWLGIGDVSGHGVTSGLIMMMAQTIQTTIEANYQVTPKDVVIAMNKVLYHNIHTRMETDHHMTFTALKYLGCGEFQHAGMHVDLLVYRQQLRDCETVETDGVFLGFIDDVANATENRTFSLNPGDILVLYTDGIIEAANSNNELFDVSRLRACVNVDAHRPLHELRETILREALEWCKHQMDDDMTLLLLRRIH